MPDAAHITRRSTTSKPAPSWRDVLPIHPAAEIFPLMPSDELRALGEDIKKNGLREPVVLFAEEGGGGIYRETEQLLLDGRNRLDAMEAVGLTTIKEGRLYLMDRFDGGYVVKYRLWKSAVTGFDPYAYVISANIRRRHLSIEDKDRLIVQLLKADPTKSNRTVAKLTDTSHPHVAQVRKRAEKAGDVETVTTSVDTKGRRQPATKPGARKKATDPLPQVSEEVLQKREEAAERIRALIGKATDDDASPGSTGEIARLRDDIDAEPPLLGILFKAWDRAPEPVRQKFMARVGLIPDPLAIPPPLRRAP